eukprot:1684733-Alexandrium_andersonii.AAC.1
MFLAAWSFAAGRVVDCLPLKLLVAARARRAASGPPCSGSSCRSATLARRASGVDFGFCFPRVRVLAK